MGTGLNYTKTNIVKGCEVSRNQLLTYKVFFKDHPKIRGLAMFYKKNDDFLLLGIYLN